MQNAVHETHDHLVPGRLGRRVVAGLLLSLVTALPGRAQVVNDTALQVEVHAVGLIFPTSFAFIGDDDILALEKFTGRVQRITGGVLAPQPVLDVAVSSISEQGLLGIAVHPRFRHNGWIYLMFTESATGEDGSSPVANRVYRYSWNGVALIDPVRILDLPVTPGPNHNGGIIEFGPDDRLYVVVGDLNRDGKLQNFPNGPAADDSGVILRVDDHGNGLADNPFFDPRDPTNPLGRTFAYGVRNSFGMAFDPISGDLWQTENGPADYDELNRFEPGANGGWERIKGPDVRDPQGVGDLWFAPGAFYVDPQFSWKETVSPTGLAFTTSPIVGCGNQHRLFVADFNCRQVYRFELDADRMSVAFSDPELDDRVADNVADRCSTELGSLVFATDFDVVLGIESGPDGALYVMDGRGWIYRIGPAPGAFPDADGDGVADACDCATADGSAFGVPVEVPRLRVSDPLPTWLGWDSQAAMAGQGVRYAVASGSLSDLRDDGGFRGACRLGESPDVPEQTDGRIDPASGDGYYYLVRAENACERGTYGAGSLQPDPRTALDEVRLPACNAQSRQ